MNTEQSHSKDLLLVIDNYDSFTYNLVQMFIPHNLEIVVKRADKTTIAETSELNPDYILISPGPKDPEHAGISMEMIKHFHDKKPILGVCLGMQCLNEVFGGRTCRAPVPVHGKTDMICHREEGIFKGMPSPFAAARYHSLVIEPHGDSLKPTAWNSEGIIMGVALTGFPVYGVQFHPESFLTEKGHIIIQNFLAHCSPLHLNQNGRVI
ncbi:anthranilate synthase component II [Desulfamplus magnetovallimortis]|nr:aminodeoxychorismate/anthranilate synthase component II [Desulfamplus magnetovallimortis]